MAGGTLRLDLQKQASKPTMKNKITGSNNLDMTASKAENPRMVEQIKNQVKSIITIKTIEKNLCK